MKNLPPRRTPCPLICKTQCPLRILFVFGGGLITLDEVNLAKTHNIPYEYFPVERKFKGDGETKITSKDSKKVKVGVTYNL